MTRFHKCIIKELLSYSELRWEKLFGNGDPKIPTLRTNFEVPQWDF